MMATVISDQNMKAIIVNGDARLLVQEADRFGHELAKDELSKSQIRGAFGTVRQIQATWEASDAQKNLRQILLLKPRLAYQKKREKKVEPLADVLITGIDLVATPDDANERTKRFGYFVDLFEAILAYHTAAGGK